MFEVKFVNENANAEFLTLPTKLKAKMTHHLAFAELWHTWRTAQQKATKWVFRAYSKSGRGHSKGDLQL